MCSDRDFADLITFAPQDMRAFISSDFYFYSFGSLSPTWAV